MSADVPLKTRLNYSLISDTEKKICEIRALIMHLCLFFAWFNLVKPYDALKIEIADGGWRMVDSVGLRSILIKLFKSLIERP